MADEQELRIILKTIAELAGATQTTAALRAVRQEAALTSGQALRMGAAIAGVNTGFAAVHQSIQAVVGAIKDVITVGAEFSGQMAGVAAVSGATAAQMVRLSEAARTGGIAIGIGGREGARGLQELIKGGISADAALGGALTSTQLLAKAGGVDLARAAEISATAMNTFGLSAADLARVADKVAGAANASSIGVDDMRLSLSQAGAVARTIGVSFDDTAVAIAELGKAGLRGSDAGTSLRTFLLSLTPSTREATDELRKLGIVTADGSNKFFDATGKARGLAEVSQILKTALVGYTDQQRLASLQLIFGTDALRAASIFAREGAAGFDSLSEAIGRIGASDVANKRLDSLQGDLETLAAQAEATTIALAKAADPNLRRGAQILTLTVKSAEEGRLDFLKEVGRQFGELIIPVGVRMVFDTSPGNIIDEVLRARKRAETGLDQGGVPLNAEADLRAVVNAQIIKEQQQAANPPAQKFLETWRTIDATLVNSRDSFARIAKDLAEIQAVSATLGTLIAALGTTNPGLTAELTTLQSIEKIRINIRANDAAAVAERNRALDKEATKITDPRDAAGALAARERTRLTQELLPLELAVAQAQKEQAASTAAIAANQNAEAIAVLQILPQRQEIARIERDIAQSIDKGLQLRQEEAKLLAQQAAGPSSNALEDTQAQIERNRLLLGIRGQDADVRRGARAENRNLLRDVLPTQRLEAFDANQVVNLAERAERITGIQNQLRANRGNQRLEPLRSAAQAGENVVFAIQQTGESLGLVARGLEANASIQQQALDAFIKKAGEPIKVDLSIAVTGPDGNTTVYKELIEANGQAQTPPAIQVSAVRR